MGIRTPDLLSSRLGFIRKNASQALYQAKLPALFYLLHNSTSSTPLFLSSLIKPISLMNYPQLSRFNINFFHSAFQACTQIDEALSLIVRYRFDADETFYMGFHPPRFESLLFEVVSYENRDYKAEDHISGKAY